MFSSNMLVCSTFGSHFYHAQSRPLAHPTSRSRSGQSGFYDVPRRVLLLSEPHIRPVCTVARTGTLIPSCNPPACNKTLHPREEEPRVYGLSTDDWLPNYGKTEPLCWPWVSRRPPWDIRDSGIGLDRFRTLQCHLTCVRFFFSLFYDTTTRPSSKAKKRDSCY